MLVPKMKCKDCNRVPIRPSRWLLTK
ncbi:hypothetical protein DU478_19020 [Thalassococcus profundi]|uniref:Uncharacterized protein n=1 Tax=Thalassococcus profundi TaxID=2282382 RepID=A0A369THC2_9RHOB|nr:hypothetical protein DU478_19020 [Thalassococcus profundi]